jgi:Flp pilus assembly protein TadG
MSRRDDDSGMITAYIAVLAIGLLFMAGLVFDGGRRINTYLKAHSLAANAARAAAQAVDPSSLYAGEPELQQADAKAAVDQFVAALPENTGVGDVEVEVVGDQVTVTLSLPFDPALLPMTGGPVSAEATSTAIQGVDEEIETGGP